MADGYGPRLWPILCIFLQLLISSSPTISNGLNQPLQLHPLSERLTSLLTRAKRQAYQVYLGGEASVSVDQGAGDSGPWSEWTTERECSRTCGGGVYVEKRECAETCTGPQIRYISCNVQPCPEDAKDFRAEQCTAHNDDAVGGKYFKWVPFSGNSINKCELTCRPEEGSNFYYKFAEKVVDGTKCDPYGDDICVDGICLPVGCDGKLGSVAKKDKCGVCNGDGSQCKTMEGLFDERSLARGYHDIIALPVGATAIHVEEVRPTGNVFAIKNATGQWLLNGDYQIQVLDKNIMAGGTAFKYEKGEGGTEKLTANGPLQEAITIALLLQRVSTKNSPVKYEFSVPLEKDVKFLYKPGEWSSCSVTCGKGIRTRALYCMDVGSQSRVDDSVCEEQNATKPEFERSCSTVDCQPEWFTGDWEPCSATCGNQGIQFRVVYCHRVFADGRRMTVPDANCTGGDGAELPRPELNQPCSRWSCPEWQAGPWSACSSQCGDARQFRSVTCRSAKEGEEGRLLAADACGDQQQPEADRDCNLGPCEGLRFHTTDWDLCQNCNDTEERRNVSCQDKNGRLYPLEKCLGNETKQIPEETRPCASSAPCIYEWHTSQWSKCSTECGHGHKSRKVFCAINELGQTKRVDQSLCGAEEKPEAEEECVNEEKCTGTYFTGPWTECSASCDGGKQSRSVVCLNYDRKPVPEWCDEKERPAESQDCNAEPCPKCSDSEFGCCPDGETFASGPFLAGCSNCSQAEFGCCSDNMTESQGAQGQGCPDFVEPSPKSDAGLEGEAAPTEGEEGSGEEPMMEEKPAAELCQVENAETGEKLELPCTTIAPPSASPSMEQLEEATTTEEPNATKHCSKTEFGCCPDWYTPAEGPQQAGCPQFVLGTCNGTKFGCCLDGVTLARGPDFEGCGESTCAGSLYGCCRDRRTIAFGPHYAGCERSSFPCELSQFGCCSDGTTAALGANGTGCGANCLLTKFGCCPDGKTQSRGPNNEGCGCEFAQYGCCPNGKDAAKGPGFYGCPDSCAQSKFGCCPDGKTSARGPNKEGCPCQYTRWGCCDDGETTALGPLNEGCDDCRYAKYGCCQDGVNKAFGPDYAGCPTTTQAPYIVAGTVSPSTIVACSLPQDQGQVCAPGYKLVWFYDTTEGRCSQFWFGGCAGNENRFNSKEQCEQICVEPPGIGRCFLPKVEGPQRCNQLAARYWYDYMSKQCTAFWHRGCLGNANNFGSWEECQNYCAMADASQVRVDYSSSRAQQQPAPHQQSMQIPQQPPQSQQVAAMMPPPPMPMPDETLMPVRQQLPPKKFDVPAFEEDDPCRLTVDSGNCQNYQDQWYFDPFSAGCHRFIYSGCGGNRNRYATEQDCMLRCGHLTKPGFLGSKYTPPPPPMPKSMAVPQAAKKAFMKTREVCNLRPDIGKCEGHFESWYYELATGQCERFTYSGCGGNANRFNSQEECQTLCLRRHDYPPPPAVRLGASPSAGVSAFGPQAQEMASLTIGSLGKAHLAGICEASKDTGTCKQFSTKWFFNKVDGTCNRFHYGGCEGNANRFDTEQECKNTCGDYRDVCLLPKVIGPCAGKTERFYFDFHSRQCLPFQYSGCLGNNNNFRSVEDCHARCQQHPTAAAANNADPALMAVRLPRRTISDTNNEQQQQPPQQTNQQSLLSLTNNPLPVEHFGNQEEEAEQEEESDDEQMDILVPREGLLFGQLPELCHLPEERGSCFGEMLRFRFDLESGDCLGFFYTGCGQNANNFLSYESCARACGRWKTQPVCEQPADTGNGSSECGRQGAAADGQQRHSGLNVPKWHFDDGLGKCSMFFWSGCGGNGNRFQSKSECENLCLREIRVRGLRGGACRAPLDAGPCEDFVTMWYFDAGQQQCRRFTFGGCRGNPNRFVSKEDCEAQCMELAESSSSDSAVDDIQQQEAQQREEDRNAHKIAVLQSSASSTPSLRRRPRIFVSPIGTLLADSSNLTLNCLGGEHDGSAAFSWYKNNRELKVDEPSSAGRILQSTAHNARLGEIHIVRAAVEDSGWYACQHGQSLISEPVNVRIMDDVGQMGICPGDKGAAEVCLNVLNSGLCSTLRYGKYCCLTCRRGRRA